MAAPEDVLYLEARAVYGKEFETWAANLLQILQSKDRGTNCLVYLRQLLVLTTVTKYNRSLSPQVYRSLRAISLEPEQGPVRIRVLAAAILRELSPLQKTLLRDFVAPTDPQNIPYILPVLLSQSNIKEQSVFLIAHICRWLSLPGIEEELCLSALSALHSILSHSSVFDKFSDDQVELIHSKVCHWLRHASRNSLSLTSSLFSSGGKKQVVPVKEIDGSTAQDVFTVLSIGDFYSCDQLLNIKAFSMLRRWILVTQKSTQAGHSPSPGATPTPESFYQDRDHSSPAFSSLTTSMVNRTATPPSHTSTPSLLTQSLSLRTDTPDITSVALQYCMRVINQCERKPLKNIDDELIKACLYEAVELLDLLCSLKRRIIHEVLSTVKTLFTRISQDESYTRVLLALVKFFINHSESEYSYEPSVQTFFGDIISNKFNDSGIAYDTVDFCLANLEKLCNSTSILTKYFPNLLKILAWSPPTYIAEFVELLPAFISETTASEVLHSLLDLPCLSAVLTANYLLTNVPLAVDQGLLPQYTKCLLALQDQTHKLMFGHFLRSESGRGDTIDRLSYMHEILEDFNVHLRVVNAGDVVPLLLKVFFKVVIHFGSKSLLSELFNVLLERSLCLYNVTSYDEEIRKVIAGKMVDIMKAHPSLLVEKSQDINEVVMNLRTLRAGGEVYLHLVWIIGEFAHTGYDSRCSAALLSKFFETLEMVGYEISLHIGQYSGYTVRLMMVLMSTLAKLASRCQDLIPRALLSLNKIVNQSMQNISVVSHRKLIFTRMNELGNILKMPSVASAVLTPPPNCCNSEEVLRQTNIATIMQSTTSLISGNGATPTSSSHPAAAPLSL